MCAYFAWCNYGDQGRPSGPAFGSWNGGKLWLPGHRRSNAAHAGVLNEAAQKCAMDHGSWIMDQLEHILLAYIL